MDKHQIYAKITKEAVKVAETDLRESRQLRLDATGKEEPTDKVRLNPDWHPYYMRILPNPNGGIYFTMVVREGDLEYFKRKGVMPDFETSAVKGMNQALKNHYPELVMVELLDNFNKTEGMVATWQ